MKKISALIVLAVLLFTSSQAMARGNTSHTAAVGAMGGALMGQAIGRDTEATIIGAALGGAIGYIVGNEMDKNSHIGNRHPSPVRVYAQPPVRPVKVFVVNNQPAHWRGRDHQWSHHKRHHYKEHHKGHQGRVRNNHSRYERW